MNTHVTKVLALWAGVIGILAGLVIIFITWPTVNVNQSTMGRIALGMADAATQAEALRYLQAFYAGIVVVVAGILLFALGLSIKD